MDPLKFVLCNGSLLGRLLMYLGVAGYELEKPDRRGFCGTSVDKRIEFWERDRRMVAQQVAGGFDAGITGRDLYINCDVQGLRTVANLCFAKRSDQPTRWVLAAQSGCQFERKVRIGTELVNLARSVLPTCTALGDYEIVRLEGNEEVAIADGLCDAVFVVTETGGTLQQLGLKIVEGCEQLFVSVPQIIAKPALSIAKEEALFELSFALQAVVDAARHVMLKADLPIVALNQLSLPAEVAPTISPLSQSGWVAIEVCLPRSLVGSVGLRIQQAGGRAIVAQDVIAYCK